MNIWKCTRSMCCFWAKIQQLDLITIFVLVLHLDAIDSFRKLSSQMFFLFWKCSDNLHVRPNFKILVQFCTRTNSFYVLHFLETNKNPRLIVMWWQDNIPFIVDQFCQVERIFWLSVAPVPLKSTCLLPDKDDDFYKWKPQLCWNICWGNVN